jgi:hypothetical protein
MLIVLLCRWNAGKPNFVLLPSTADKLDSSKNDARVNSIGTYVYCVTSFLCRGNTETGWGMTLVPRVTVGMAGLMAPQHQYRIGAQPFQHCPAGTFSVADSTGTYSGSVTPLCSGSCKEGYFGDGNYSNELCEGPCPKGTVCHRCPKSVFLCFSFAATDRLWNVDPCDLFVHLDFQTNTTHLVYLRSTVHSEVRTHCLVLQALTTPFLPRFEERTNTLLWCSYYSLTNESLP